jgi:hypothetical protein
MFCLWYRLRPIESDNLQICVYHLHFIASVMLSHKFIICVKLALYVLNHWQDLWFLKLSYGTTIKNSVPFAQSSRNHTKLINELLIHHPLLLLLKLQYTQPSVVEFTTVIFWTNSNLLCHHKLKSKIAWSINEVFIEVLLTTIMYWCNSLQQSLHLLRMQDTCH